MKLVHLLVKDLKSLCIYYIWKQDTKDEFQPDENEDKEKLNPFHNYSQYSPHSMAPAAFNNLESPLSMVEKTAKWILPVINAV